MGIFFVIFWNKIWLDRGSVALIFQVIFQLIQKINVYRHLLKKKKERMGKKLRKQIRF